MFLSLAGFLIIFRILALIFKRYTTDTLRIERFSRTLIIKIIGYY